MTPEEKKLLFKDLCARLPYRVKGLHRGQVHIIANMDGGSLYPSIQVNGYNAWFPVETFKPYLRPMSSMTGAEVLEYIGLKEKIVASDDITYSFETYESIDWLNAHYFDYRGLIEKKLALEAPEGMYNN